MPRQRIVSPGETLVSVASRVSFLRNERRQVDGDLFGLSEVEDGVVVGRVLYRGVDVLGEALLRIFERSLLFH